MPNSHVGNVGSFDDVHFSSLWIAINNVAKSNIFGNARLISQRHFARTVDSVIQDLAPRGALGFGVQFQVPLARNVFQSGYKVRAGFLDIIPKR